MTTLVVRIGGDSLRRRLILLLAATVVASVLVLGYAAVKAFDRAVEPELANRTRLIGSIIRTEIQRALELGIPIDAMAGLEGYLSDTLEQFGEVKRIEVATAGGESIAAAQSAAAPTLMERTGLAQMIELHRATFVLPIVDRNRLVGSITIEISPVFVQTRLRDVFLDVLVLALIATLVAVELSLALTIASVGKPLDRVLHLLREQGAGRFLHRIRPGGLGGLGRTAARLNDHAEDLAARFAPVPAALRERMEAVVVEGRPRRLRLSDFNDIRLALLVFSVSAEIATAFLPLYAGASARPEWLSVEIAAAAPLALYLAAVAALSPFGGTLVRKFGARRVFLASVPPLVACLLGMALSDGVLMITVWRGAMGLCYAAATIACQEYAIRAAGEHRGARPLGAFIAVIYGGVFCGSALGGLVAGRFGYGAALVVGAALAIFSGVLGAVAMHGRAGDRETTSAAAPAGRSGKPPWRDARFLVLLAGIAVPMNATTAIVVWYLTPLMLSEGGYGPADIGRVIMLYYLAVVLIGPMVARLSDIRHGPLALLLVGALGSAAALLSLGLWNGFWAIAVLVVGLGLGHTAIRTPLYTLALGATGGPGPGIDALRLLERLGALAGLAASALLLGDIGAVTSIRALGLVVLGGVIIYAIVEMLMRSRQRV